MDELIHRCEYLIDIYGDDAILCLPHAQATMLNAAVPQLSSALTDPHGLREMYAKHVLQTLKGKT